jgi:hypothetical protein
MDAQCVPLKWYNFSQNNSGGSFVVDENVAEEIFIQAVSADEAIRKAEKFCDNSDSCECCGDRWSLWVRESDGHSEPNFYDGRVESYKFGSGRPLHALPVAA